MARNVSVKKKVAPAPAPEREIIHRRRRTQDELQAVLEEQLKRQLEKADSIRRRIESLNKAKFSTIIVLSKAIPDVKTQLGEDYVVTPEFLVGMAAAIRKELDAGDANYGKIVALGEKHISKSSEEMLRIARRSKKQQ